MARIVVKASPRRIPPIDRLLRDKDVEAALQEIGPGYGMEILRAVVTELRQAVLRGDLEEAGLRERLSSLGREIRDRAREEARPGLVPLINATGVIIHTNLGRALLSGEAKRRVAEICDQFVDLEYDLETGRRGGRAGRVHQILAGLIPGSAFHLVNNNAAALLLVLNSLAEDREVIVSRGELVEIGGSFRLPEILAKSGARLREIGTTNRTRIGDYAAAVGPETGAILRVHTSNFRIIGFVESASVEELARLAKANRLPLIVDEGAGNLHDLSDLGIPGEPTVREILAAGADLITFSGDKLLGGPQAGIIAGREALVRRLRNNPLSRALRVDKMTLAALEATLMAHRRGTHRRDIPVQKMIAAAPKELRARTEKLAGSIRKRCGNTLEVNVLPGESVVGGGAAPARGLPTFLVALKPRDRTVSKLSGELRRAEPPIITRAGKDAVLIDLRAVPRDRDETVVQNLERLFPARGKKILKRGTGR